MTCMVGHCLGLRASQLGHFTLQSHMRTVPCHESFVDFERATCTRGSSPALACVVARDSLRSSSCSSTWTLASNSHANFTPSYAASHLHARERVLRWLHAKDTWFVCQLACPFSCGLDLNERTSLASFGSIHVHVHVHLRRTSAFAMAMADAPRWNQLPEQTWQRPKAPGSLVMRQAVPTLLLAAAWTWTWRAKTCVATRPTMAAMCVEGRNARLTMRTGAENVG